MKVLVVVDMQNDFIDGALGTPEAQAIVPKVVKKIEEFDGEVLWTQDTHSDDYLETQEGRLLPVKHCISASNGWQIHSSVKAAIQSCLKRIKLTVPAGETIAMPFKIGCGLGGGDWNVILGLIQKELSDKYTVELWRKEV